MIKVSVGTAHVLGLKKIMADAFPTTAYLLVGEKCSRDCSFCSQARTGNGRADMLSRVIWPEYGIEQVASGIIAAGKTNQISRTCLQVVNKQDAQERAKELLQEFTAGTGVPVCISCSIKNPVEGKQLIDLGADKIGIALDCASPALYRKVKGGSWQRQLKLIQDTAQLLPGRVSTHIIVGLGEREEEIVRIIAQMVDWSVTVALFAFTPIKGTRDQEKQPPGLAGYRRVQAARFLLAENLVRLEDFMFAGGIITGFGLSKEKLIDYLADGRAFQTAGCPGCNRPYYNEKPGGIIYNYPRAMTEAEIGAALAMLG